MATTTNYSWTTPDNTAYVKDGASAIRSLGSSVDTTLFGITNGKNVGLVPLNTTTFTTQSAVAVNTVFSSTYTNYRLVFNITASTNASILFRFRNAGSDIATTNYFYHFAASDSGSTAYGTAGVANSATSFPLNDNTIASPLAGAFDVFNPGIAANKRLNGISSWGTASNHKGGQSFCGVNLTGTYDGFSLIASSGTITGNVSVYGYRV
jgi:hypothetical protein